MQLPISAADAYGRITNLGSMQDKIAALPDDIKAKVGDLTLTDDTITLNSTPMGALTLKVSERVEGRRVAYQAQGAPVPVILAVNIEPKGDAACEVVAAIDVELPAMLKPMVGPKLQEAASKLGDMMKNIVSLS